jgi:phosphatidylserine/phosphatidylglycerophosphate/cardiolipin synthase-like enzyme
VSDISVRWADTRTEQFHSKVLRLSGPETDLLCLGSANWTRRNLGNLNLEANLLLRECGALGQEWDAYYDALWSNAHNAEASLPYAAHALSGWSLRWKTALYRFQEWTGLSTF